MNAKEQIIQELKEKILNTIRFGNENYIQQLEALIVATESAIFNLPSRSQIIDACNSFSNQYQNGFKDCYESILNYNKPESDGK